MTPSSPHTRVRCTAQPDTLCTRCAVTPVQYAQCEDADRAHTCLMTSLRCLQAVQFMGYCLRRAVSCPLTYGNSSIPGPTGTCAGQNRLARCVQFVGAARGEWYNVWGYVTIISATMYYSSRNFITRRWYVWGNSWVIKFLNKDSSYLGKTGKKSRYHGLVFIHKQNLYSSKLILPLELKVVNVSIANSVVWVCVLTCKTQTLQNEIFLLVNWFLKIPIITVKIIKILLEEDFKQIQNI